MEKEIDFFELQRELAQRKAALGITETDAEMFRNSGLRRKAEKRAFLSRIAERCRQAGIAPLKANY